MDLSNQKTLSQIIALLGLIISLSGNVVQCSSNSINQQASEEKNRILQEKNKYLNQQLVKRDDAFNTKVKAIQDVIDDLEIKNRNLKANLDYGSVLNRFDRLKEIKENEKRIIELKESIADITY